MMAKEPKRRFQEPKEVAEALLPFFKKGPLAFQSMDAEVWVAGRWAGPSGAGRRQFADAAGCEECGVGCPKEERRQAASSRNGGERPRRLSGAGTRYPCDTGHRLISAVCVVVAVGGHRSLGTGLRCRVAERYVQYDNAGPGDRAGEHRKTCGGSEADSPYH